MADGAPVTLVVSPVTLVVSPEVPARRFMFALAHEFKIVTLHDLREGSSWAVTLTELLDVRRLQRFVAECVDDAVDKSEPARVWIIVRNDLLMHAALGACMEMLLHCKHVAVACEKRPKSFLDVWGERADL